MIGTDTVWFGLLLFNGTFSTNRLYRAKEYEIYYIGPVDKTNIQLNNETIQTKKIINTL